MSTIYTRRLGAGISVTNTEVLIATGSPEQTTIIRDLVLANNGANGGLAALYITDVSGTTHFIVSQQLAAASQMHLELRQELPPGARLVLYGGLDGITVMVTGYLFGP